MDGGTLGRYAMVRGTKRRLIVEGGGTQNPALQTECRRAFRRLLERAGVTAGRPRIVAAGGRRRAYDLYTTAIKNSQSGEHIVLLVDADEPVTSETAWEHVRTRGQDGWSRPEEAGDEDLHLMVQCMEAWFLADPHVLGSFFGQGFKQDRLPKGADIEAIPKQAILDGLRAASAAAKTKGKYGKGSHSFKILSLLDPQRIKEASPWARRFFESL